MFCDPVETSLEAVFLINSADFGFYGGWVSFAFEEFIGGEADEHFAVHFALFFENPFADIEG